MGTRKISLLAALLLLPLGVLAGGLKEYQAKQVSPHVYVIHGPMGLPSKHNHGFINNPAFVVAPQGVILVDPGSSKQIGAMILKQVEKVSKKPVVAIFNTHYHGDHWLGNHGILEKYPKIPIYASKKMLKRVKNGVGEEWHSLIMNLTEGAIKGTVVKGPTHVAQAGKKLKLGGFTFRIHEPPKAHTEADILIELVEDHLIFTGDICMNRRLGRMDDGSFFGAKEAMDLAIQQKAKVYVPGHGMTAGMAMAKECKSYYQDFTEAVTQSYRNDLDQMGMSPVVKKALQPYHGWSGFEENFGKHLSLTFLEVEEREF